MNINKDQAIAMLADGIPTSQIAAALGVDDSYISQLKADPEIQTRIQELAAGRTAEDMRFDDLLETAEMKALERIEKNLHFANMGQAMNAFRILNGAKKRRDSIPGGAAASLAVNVNLTLPQVGVVRYVTNEKNEIIEVEGKTMLSANVKSLDQILAERAGGKLLPQLTDMEKAADVLDRLPTPQFARPARAPARQLPAVLSADIL